MNRALSGPVLLAAFLCLCFPALAQPGSRWLEVHTQHFTVLTNSSEKDARKTAVQFERMRTVFRVIIPSASDDAAAPIVVLALKDSKSFRTLEPAAYLEKNQLQLAGLFVQAPNRNYVLTRLDAEGEHPFATIYHEYTHYMLRRGAAWMPLWMNEGLAEFYQNTDIQDKDVRLGQPSQDDILYLRQSRLLPLKTLLTVDHNSPYYHDEQKGSVFYAESWALTHYLQVSDFDNKTRHLQDYAKYLQAHEDPVAAAEHAFGDLNKLEKALVAYVSGMSFKEFKLVSPVTFTESSFEVRPAPTAEADAIRADVLLCTQRQKESESLLETVLAADPRNAQAHETMGMLKFSAGDRDAARKWFSEAVQLDSKSYLAHYYFAAFALEGAGSDQDAAIDQSLRTSITLNPQFAPSYDALAHFYASRHEKLDEAYKLVSTAIQLEPENLNYRINASQVLAQDQKMVSAISVLKTAKPLAVTDADKQMLANRLTEMEEYQASLARAQSYQRAAPSDGTVTTSGVSAGKPVTVIVAAAAEEPEYPSGPPAGPRHAISGVLRGIKCSYPSVLTLTLDRPGQPVSLYTNNYFKVIFTTANYTPDKDIVPCSSIEGMKAKVVYGEVKDARVVGQILSIELSR